MKFRPLMYIITIVLVIAFGVTSTSAEELDVQIETNKNFIEVLWSDIGSKYIVYELKDNNGKYVKLWEGKDTTFVHKNLEPDRLYRYKIVALDSNNEVIEEMLIYTSTQKSSDQVKNLIENNREILSKNGSELHYTMTNPNLSIIYSNQQAKLTWINIPSDLGYEVYRNGELLGTVNNNYFIDYDVKKDKVYQYTVVGYKRLPNEKIKDINSKLDPHAAKAAPADDENSSSMYT